MAETSNNTFNSHINGGRVVDGQVHGGIVVQGDYYATGQPPSIPASTSSQPSSENWQHKLRVIQSSLREIYSQSYRSVVPFSLPFYFDADGKWVNLSLKLEKDSTVTEDYANLLKKAFAKAKMLIIEGDPGIGKSSLMHRLAYEWTKEESPLRNDYVLVLYIEFRKIFECKFKDIEELIIRYMKLYFKEEDYKIFHHFINDSEFCKEHKILVLLDGYDESSSEEQCQELSDFFSSTTSTPLRFYVIITSRKGYLSKFRSQGRFIFADIVGFTAESQRQEFISKHFKAANDAESSGNTEGVIRLLNNANLNRLAETPLMLTFICILHKKITDGTEVELYMNIIWWMIDRYQKSNPNLDVPKLFDFEHHESDNFSVIQNNYQYFPQLHMLGTMAMQDIFKSTFTERDLEKFKIKGIAEQVGFLRKEVTRDTSFQTKTEFSFVHRTVQEFIMALTFFLTNKEPPKVFINHVFFIAANKGYGIVPANIQANLEMIYCSKIKINESKKKLYSKNIKLYMGMHPSGSSQQEGNCISQIYSQADTIDAISKHERIPQSSEEAIQLLRDEAEKGDTLAQYNLGLMYLEGKITAQSDKEAAKWFRKSAEQGNATAQYKLGRMYFHGKGVPQSYKQAGKWTRKAAEQGNADAQHILIRTDRNGTISQSDEEAVKWNTKSAEQGNTDAQLKRREVSYIRTIEGWPLRLLRYWTITYIVSSVLWIIIIFIFKWKIKYKQLASFNKNSTVAFKQEIDLHYLKQVINVGWVVKVLRGSYYNDSCFFKQVIRCDSIPLLEQPSIMLDDSLQRAVYCSVIQCIINILELCLIRFQSSGKHKRKTILFFSITKILRIMVAVQLLAALVKLCFFILIKRSEPEDEIFLLFSSFASGNSAGFRVMEEKFSCQGYELATADKESSPDDNCTKTLRDIISQTKQFALVIIIYILVNVCISFVIIAYCTYLIRKHPKNAAESASRDVSWNQENLELQRLNAKETEP